MRLRWGAESALKLPDQTLSNIARHHPDQKTLTQGHTYTYENANTKCKKHSWKIIIALFKQATTEMRYTLKPRKIHHFGSSKPAVCSNVANWTQLSLIRKWPWTHSPELWKYHTAVQNWNHPCHSNRLVNLLAIAQYDSRVLPLLWYIGSATRTSVSTVALWNIPDCLLGPARSNTWVPGYPKS